MILAPLGSPMQTHQTQYDAWPALFILSSMTVQKILCAHRVQEEKQLDRSLDAYDALLAAGAPSEMAKVLLRVESLLLDEGCMDEVWCHHWQSNWQRAASYCVDWKHALLLTATLQVESPLDLTKDFQHP